MVTGQHYLSFSAESSSPNQRLMPLTAQVNAHHHLELGGMDIKDLVNQFGTPLYIVDEHTLRTACRQYRQNFQQYYPGDSLVIYASKAWNCLAICAIVAQEGLGIDVVSGGELYTALQAGVPTDRLYFHGNNKSAAELSLALEAPGITIVVDNLLELETLAELAKTRSLASPQRVMIRFTPGIECHTHEYIRTGQLDSKFGFSPEQLPTVFRLLKEQPQLQCVGLHAHIGSQIFELQPHQDLTAVLVQAFQDAQAAGLAVSEVNVGGGLGIRYTEADDPPSIEEWAKQVSTALVAACDAQGIPYPRLICEPGRSLVGSSCVTAYTVGSRKDIPDLKRYITVDGGMSDNPRPITYQSLYRAVVANRMDAPADQTVTIAGKHCESGDIVIHNAQLPETEPGDIVVVLATGAYNYSMASNYNRLPRPAAVLVKDGDASLILQRETYEDLIRYDRLPDSLVNP
ncbi:MAG: diaminopimelate decarboxylase [Prochlorotrichaceae cyanobacterium]|jgi:diaminopimelate decarboxylase